MNFKWLIWDGDPVAYTPEKAWLWTKARGWIAVNSVEAALAGVPATDATIKDRWPTLPPVPA